MQAQLAMGIPWGIVSLASPESAREPFWFGDDLPVPPLIGREFRHGVTDCFALVRDWFRVELGVTIPNYPRQHEWWKADKNMFIDLFRDAGFRRIPRVERKGDCVIGMVLGRVPNHSGVYLGGGLILHHLERRLSRQEPIGPWMKYVTHCLRHEG
jgi:cell wall-associated NlpC family hydrolase